MKFFIALTLCALSAFQGCQSRGINPVTDEVLEVFEALKNGNVQSVENSLSSVSVNSEDDHGFTFLMRAAENGNEAMVEMLLKHGADVNKSDWLNKFTPLQLANKERGCEYSWGCDARGKANYDRISELLIKNGADVNLVNAHGITLLHDVAQNGFENVAELIFKNGGSKTVNQKSGSVSTPLCFVAYNGGYPEGHDRIAELMIQNGADVNLRCGESTPLHLAAIKDRLGIVKLLVENGADVSLKNKDGKTPLDLVKSEGSDSYKDVIEYLEQHEKH